MSCKGRRAAAHERVVRFDWQGTAGVLDHPAQAVAAEAAAAHVVPAPAPQAPDFGALERDAFAKGFAQGERSGEEASATRVDAMLRRLASTLDELIRVRADMIRRTERQVVQLAMAVAKRIVRREVEADRELLVAMARVALDRLGDTASARIRLHPDDCAAVERLNGRIDIGSVQVVPDAHVHRGGCVVDSDVGVIDVGVDAQVEELSRSLLSQDGAAAPVPGLTASNAAHADR